MTLFFFFNLANSREWSYPRAEKGCLPNMLVIGSASSLATLTSLKPHCASQRSWSVSTCLLVTCAGCWKGFSWNLLPLELDLVYKLYIPACVILALQSAGRTLSLLRRLEGPVTTWGRPGRRAPTWPCTSRWYQWWELPPAVGWPS